MLVLKVIRQSNVDVVQQLYISVQLNNKNTSFTLKKQQS